MQDRDGQVPTDEEAVSRLKVVVVEEGGGEMNLGDGEVEMRERAAGSLKAKADEMGGSKESGRLSPISRVRLPLTERKTHQRTPGLEPQRKCPDNDERTAARWYKYSFSSPSI